MGSRSSTTDPPGSSPEDIVIVGTVRRPHGVRGEVMVEVLTDVEGRFAPGRTFSRVPAGRATPSGTLTIATARTHKGAALLRFEGVEDRDAADALRGVDLAVPAADSPAPPEGTWYHHQLIGCRVTDAKEGELGTVTGVTDEGGGAMLVLEPPGGGDEEILVPFVRAFLVRVSPQDGVIETDLPEGLIEACASGS
jgi:16S rRNA processing protein RimM